MIDNPLDDVLFHPSTENDAKSTDIYKGVYEHKALPKQLDFVRNILNYTSCQAMKDPSIREDSFIDLSVLPSFLYGCFLDCNIPTLTKGTADVQVDILQVEISVIEGDTDRYYTALKVLGILGFSLSGEVVMTRDVFEYLKEDYSDVILLQEIYFHKLNCIEKTLLAPVHGLDVINHEKQKIFRESMQSIYHLSKTNTTSANINFSNLQYYILHLHIRLKLCQSLREMLHKCSLIYEVENPLFNTLGIIKYNLSFSRENADKIVDEWFQYLLSFGIVMNDWRHNHNIKYADESERDLIAKCDEKIPVYKSISHLHCDLYKYWLVFIYKGNAEAYKHLSDAFKVNDPDAIVELIKSMR